MYTNSGAAAREALWNEPCLAAKVRRLHRVVVAMYDQALRHQDLTVAQLELLMRVLVTKGRVRPTDLARALQMDRSTVARHLGRLEARGLIATEPGASGRETLVKVTPAGRRAAEEAAGAWFAAQQATRTRLREDGQAALDLVTRRLTPSQKED